MRAWVRAEGPECDNFDEICCRFFGTATGVLNEYKEFGLTDQQYLLLFNFRTEFELFANENDYPEEFIDTRKWIKITEMAKEMLKSFNYGKC
ncbi:MAG: hypothetical protein JSR76_01015 [Verrucomicrobia bacterium]|nr:hypothetical protein [Verrucomicrobiota bacterium]